MLKLKMSTLQRKIWHFHRLTLLRTRSCNLLKSIIQILPALKNDMILHFCKVSVDMLGEVWWVHSPMSLSTQSCTLVQKHAFLWHHRLATGLGLVTCKETLSLCPCFSFSISVFPQQMIPRWVTSTRVWYCCYEIKAESKVTCNLTLGEPSLVHTTLQ